MTTPTNTTCSPIGDKFGNRLRWAGAFTMFLLILMLIVEGTWAVGLYHSWPFVIVVMLATLLMLWSAIRDMRRHHLNAAVSHVGLSFVLMGGMLGAVVTEEVQIVVDRHATERVAYTERGEALVLPFAMRLQDFHIDYYDNGTSPKQYTSTLEITPVEEPAETIVRTTSVNHPLRYDGWWIYQQDYDRQQGDFCIIKLVRDPWLWLVFTGFVLLLAGAFLQTRKAWHTWKVLPATLVLAAVFTAASLARIELGTLVPALRSFWFFPHILVYMIAYSLLAVALVISCVGVFGKRPAASELAHKLLQTTSALLLIGMLCGAVWAKDAWGQYWTWDAKECWAAVTWLITVAGAHIPLRKNHAVRTLVVIAVTFAVIQITWYGVNYLPAAQYSMHTYNKG